MGSSCRGGGGGGSRDTATMASVVIGVAIEVGFGPAAVAALGGGPVGPIEDEAFCESL